MREIVNREHQLTHWSAEKSLKHLRKIVISSKMTEIAYSKTQDCTELHSLRLSASQGGTHAILGQECCSDISDGFEAQYTGIILIERTVEDKHKEEHSSWWDWLTSWPPNWRLLQNVLVAVIVIIVVSVLACIMIQCYRCCNTLWWKMKERQSQEKGALHR